jgi:hypothetical protein
MTGQRCPLWVKKMPKCDIASFIRSPRRRWRAKRQPISMPAQRRCRLRPGPSHFSMEPSQQFPRINNRLTQGLQPLADRLAASVAHSMAGQGQHQRALGSFKMCQPGPEHRDGRRSAIDQMWRVPHRSRHAKPLGASVCNMVPK